MECKGNQRMIMFNREEGRKKIQKIEEREDSIQNNGIRPKIGEL